MQRVKTINGRNRHLMAAVIMTMLALFGTSFAIEEQPLDAWSGFSKKNECKKLMGWLRKQAVERLTGAMLSSFPEIETPPFFGSLGIFITLKKGNKVRGCYGAFSHSSVEIGRLLSDYLAGALTRDPRYPPLDVGELSNTDIILTLASMPSPVSDIGAVDLHQYGMLMVCDGDETTVFVPAEIRTVSYIERFMKGRTCQISAFRAITIR
jgi:hypothetical protein